LPEEERAAVWSLVARVRGKLVSELQPDGFNVGVNDGAAAGQTVPHAHVHVIPRRAGDVADPRGGVRWVVPAKARYWVEEQP
jgi:diadenosine tetraphosphate (Ap4A) HIT family hydrolase